jgi:hypothetical protein
MAAPLLVVAAQFTAVRPTNFAGHDEWLVLSLAARGLLSFPYADRPLALLWSLPARWLSPGDVVGHEWAHVAYLAAAGALTGWLGLRRLGLSPAAALLAGVLAATWAPLDAARLNVVQVGTRYSGCTAAALAAIVLFVEGFFRGRPLAAAAGAGLAAVTVLCIEGTLPLLAAAPLVALAADPRARLDPASRRRLAAWSAAWWLFLALTIVPVLLSLAGLRGGYRYQSAIGLDPHPLRLGRSLLDQLAFSLGPLLAWPGEELARASVALSVAALVCALAALAHAAGDGVAVDGGRAALTRAAALGLMLAILGWLPLVLSPLVRTPARNQILSAPGVALLIASTLALVAGPLPRRARVLAVAVLGAWTVAVGAGRVGALQDEWDGTTFWRAQRGSLAQLVTQAPALAPNTIVVLVDGTRSWATNFGFTHAIHLLYGEEVVGLVFGGHEFLYSARFEPEGIAREPWPVIQEAWRSPPTRHRYDEVVAARLAGGRLRVLDDWPAELPALPAGASYAPRARIRPGPPAPSARILARER